jgi:DNA-binding NarL/FixJ family response regulator
MRILLADDHPLFRLALAQAVRAVAPDAAIAEAGTFDEARRDLAAHADTDLVLLDLHMPGSHGLMGLATLRGEHPSIAVAMISAHDDPATICRALAYGAAGFISKRTGLDELQEALRAVLACQTWLPPTLRGAVAATTTHIGDRELAARLATLSPQQMRVLGLVAEGLLNKQIADRLGVQERTVKAHLTAIFERLDVRNRTQAGVLLRSLELADPANVVDARGAGERALRP